MRPVSLLCQGDLLQTERTPSGSQRRRDKGPFEFAKPPHQKLALLIAFAVMFALSRLRR